MNATIERTASAPWTAPSIAEPSRVTSSARLLSQTGWYSIAATRTPSKRVRWPASSSMQRLYATRALDLGRGSPSTEENQGCRGCPSSGVSREGSSRRTQIELTQRDRNPLVALEASALADEVADGCLAAAAVDRRVVDGEVDDPPAFGEVRSAVTHSGHRALILRSASPLSAGSVPLGSRGHGDGSSGFDKSHLGGRR